MRLKNTANVFTYLNVNAIGFFFQLEKVIFTARYHF